MSEQAIFLAALEIADPAERAAYVDQACAGDAALGRQVLALLAAHEGPGKFMDVPVVQQVARGGAQSDDGTLSLDAEAGKALGRAVADDFALDFLQPSAKSGSLGRLGHYEVLEVLGRGGFGVVVKAFDDVLHRVVAIKVLAPHLAATSPPRKRFLREARSAARIRHENVVTIYAVEEQPIPHLVMEFIPGQTLQEKLDETGPLDVVEVLRMGQQIANGLAAAHGMGLIHRDIKPSNILLERGSEQRAKITDFGLARTADDASLTQSGIIAGTPMYMAPEQANGEVIDQRADLFSLGSVLYVMCSGRPPFRASTTLAVLKRVAEDPPRPIREIIPEVPEWLCAIVAKLHAKQPAHRIQTAKEVADLLACGQSDLQQRVCAQPIANLAKPAPSAPSSAKAHSEVAELAATADQEVRRQREALALAVNDHDLESIKRFIHPSYVGKCKNGYTSGYQEIIGLAERMCAVGSDFQEVVQIENLIVDGDTARLTVRRSCSMTYLQCITHRGVIRAVETWRKLDNRWQVVEEQELEHLSGYLGPDEQARRWLTRAGIVAAAVCALAALVVAACEYLWPFPGNNTGVPATRIAVRDEGKPDRALLPPAPPLELGGPFVVVGSHGRSNWAYATLKDAVDNAQSGDTIEIRGDGPVVTAPAVIDKALTLRPAAGQKPILVHKTTGTLLRAIAPLTLVGLELSGDQHKEEGETLIEADGAPLRITHCRIMVRGKNAVWAHASPLLEVQDSEIIARNWGAINWDVTDKGKLVVKDCASVAWGAVWLHHHNPAVDAEVELTGNTFFSSCFCGHRFYQDPVDAQPKKDNPYVRIKATRNVIRSAEYLCLLEYGDMDRPFQSEALGDWYRDHVSWKGTDNLVAVHAEGSFLMIRQFDPTKGGAAHLITFKEWKEFWKAEKLPWIEGTPRFVGGDLLQRVLWEDMENVTPAEFRLKTDSPGKGLGADVDRVGPGTAYESWMKTPEYQEWRKKTEDLIGRP